MADQEKKWIKKIKKGQKDSFKKLYDHYVNDALRTAYAITKSNNHAADIVQEAFVKVYRNIEKFQLDKPFKPWFYRILLNESRRYMKKENKQAVAARSEELLDHLHDSPNEKGGESDVELALEQLPEIHRTALTLKYVNEFTEGEIAELLDLNVNTVKSRLYKGRLKLKAIIIGGKYNGR